jgi:hypothetical protein
VISKWSGGDWDRNFPDWSEINPGEGFVIDVNLDPTVWQKSPLSGDSGKTKIRLKAIYEIREDTETKHWRIWTGRVSSAGLEYSLSWTGRGGNDKNGQVGKSGRR